MLKIIVLSQVFITNIILAANKFGVVENSGKLIKKSVKLKIRKLSKVQKLPKS